MTRKCTVCNHKDVDKIDAALVIEGASYRDIARQYGLTQAAIGRHFKNGHIADKVLADSESAQKVASKGLASDVDYVRQESQDIYEEERHKKNNRLALDALDRILKSAEIRAKLAGQIETGNKVIININGDDSNL